MSKSDKSLVISRLTGGRNGFDPPAMIPDDQCVEALNVDWNEGTLAHKRNGATAIAVTFSSGGPFAGAIGALVRHVPADDETAAELWAFCTVGVPAVVGRLAGATTWTVPTFSDAYISTVDVFATVGVSLNGMLFLAYHSGQNRLHAYDPSLSKVRRVGLATPATPTTTNMGAGGLSFSRYYRVRWVDISGSDTRRRSEASASTAVVTIAGLLGVTVNRPTLAAEDETHWEVEYADAPTGPWYRAAQVAKATTTYNDTEATISTTNLSAEDGINYPPPSAKFMLSDDNRIIMAGNHETSGGYITPKSTRIWFTPVLGSTDIGDSERMTASSYLSVEAAVTALGGPLQGCVYVFSYRRIWKLVPTGAPDSPYQKYAIVNGIGCIHHKSVISAEDENGNPALYFLSHRGPCRIGAFGLQYIGSDVEDLWATINLAATNGVAHGVFHADKHQVWWWIATGASNTPDTKIVFDTRLGRAEAADAVRKGWAKHTGDSASAYASVMFSSTVGATMSRDLRPYIAQPGGNGRIWKCDSTATDDAGTAFQAYVDTKEYAPGGLGTNVALDEPSLMGETASGVTITVTGRADHGARTDATGTALLTAAGSESRVQKKVEGFQSAQVGTVSYRIGDASAVSNGWTLDALLAPYRVQEKR